MTRLRGSAAALAAVVLVLLSACARATDSGGQPSGGEPSAGSAGAAGTAGGLVLRVKHEGGFVPPDQIVGRIPAVSVYADGRVITEGPQILIYPGPALPNLQVHQLDPAQVQDLVDRAVEAGVRAGADFGQPGVADAPSTVVEVVTSSGPQQVSVVALGEAMPDDPQLTPAQRAARAKLAAFVKEVSEPSGATQPYQAETLAALAQPYTKTDDGVPGEPAAIAWPGPALPGEKLSSTVELGCVSATGAERDAILAAAEKANQGTPWISGGKQFTVTFRPLLPDESSCADLKAGR